MGQQKPPLNQKAACTSQRRYRRVYRKISYTPWFVVSVFAVMLLGNLPPLSFIDGAFLKYFGVPFALTWFMCQKTFDGKKPYGFLKSVLAYLVRPKLTYAGKPVKLEKEYPAQPITAVRSDIYGISD